jgi:hypothetical protein
MHHQEELSCVLNSRDLGDDYTCKEELSCVLNSRDLGYKTYMHIIVWNVWNLLLPENEKYLNVCDTVMCLPGSKQEITSLVGQLLLLQLQQQQ